jgi:hypothetical protein
MIINRRIRQRHRMTRSKKIIGWQVWKIAKIAKKEWQGRNDNKGESQEDKFILE